MSRTLPLALLLALAGCLPAPAATTSFNDNAGPVSYTGSWSTVNTDDKSAGYQAGDPYGAYQHDFRLSATAGSTASFAFTGNSIAVIGTYADNFGQADVAIDGGAATTVDYFIKPYEFPNGAEGTRNYKHNRAIFLRDGLPDGPHTITVTVRGTRNPASSGYGVTIDAFIVRDADRARGTTVFASSSIEANGWSRDGLVDGRRDPAPGALGWSSDASPAGDRQEWVQIDLGATNFIDRIDLYPGGEPGHVGEYFPVDFRIEVANEGGDWTTVVARAGYPQPGAGAQTFRIAAQTARYIKVTGTSLRQSSRDPQSYRMQFAEVVAAYDTYRHVGTTAAAPDATYYVSSSGGDDDGAGTSPETAWRTLTRASTLIYAAGNSILLKRGDAWVGQTLHLHGDGTASRPIVVSAYGTGAKPILVGDKGEAAASIRIVDNHGYRITGLELTGGVFGIQVLADATDGHDFLDMDDLYIHDVGGRSITKALILPYPGDYFGAAIAITALMDAAHANRKVFSNIRLTNTILSNNDTGFINLVRDKPFDHSGLPTNAWYSDRSVFSNVNITNTKIYRSKRCGGIMMYGTSGGVADNVLIDETGVEKGMFWGVAAFQIANSENFTIRNCEFLRTARTNNSPDGEGVDFESGNAHIALLNSYIHDNAGPAFMLYGENGGWGLNNTDVTVDGVYAYRNGTEGAGEDSWAIKHHPRNSGVVRNSLFLKKFASQEVVSAPVAFDASNYIANPDWSEAFGPGRTRWALGRPVASSSSVTDFGWSDAGLTDGIGSSRAAAGNTANGWSSNANLTANHAEWVQVDLGTPRPVDRIDLWAHDKDTTYFPVDFAIQSSTDGANWTTMLTFTDHAQPSADAPRQGFTCPRHEARYVRVIGTRLRPNPKERGFYRMQIAELDVFHSDSAN